MNPNLQERGCRHCRSGVGGDGSFCPCPCHSPVKGWEEELFDLSEKYCDHEKWGGECLYHVLEPFISAERARVRKEGADAAIDYVWERTREVGIVEGENIRFHADQLAGILEVARKKALRELKENKE